MNLLTFFDWALARIDRLYLTRANERTKKFGLRTHPTSPPNNIVVVSKYQLFQTKEERRRIETAKVVLLLLTSGPGLPFHT